MKTRQRKLPLTLSNIFLSGLDMVWDTSANTAVFNALGLQLQIVDYRSSISFVYFTHFAGDETCFFVHQSLRASVMAQCRDDLFVLSRHSTKRSQYRIHNCSLTITPRFGLYHR